MTAPSPSPSRSPGRSLGLVVIGAVLGGMTGFLYAAGAGITLDGHDHATGHTQHGGQHGGHDHDEMVEIGSNDARIQLVVHRDTVSGVNLEVVTTVSPMRRTKPVPTITPAKVMVIFMSMAKRSRVSMGRGITWRACEGSMT